ncbi:uncharacterized protein HMPREF1541_08539 [Cyphellophora europaea CBS 101466]|uniref:Aminotransferase class I/classII large domain-containing protein n=1 Tax=Cyphellophora europaea (strain CBS 101466) TaxID=1220924 RepID=W2RIC1_CYPE1|nr:uncharacterized protein HMPREF1541_08539 [Cyphellophora europaea CBS 101466]ETN36262.1 hypothetical protein HMPREF1541_08539 [Cyphellophora europaea CBS 101466]
MIAKEPRASIDLSHHINVVSRSRNPSPLKDIVKYMAVEGMVSLAGGLPHPSLFPFASVSLSAYKSNTVLDAYSPDEQHPLADDINIGRDSAAEQMGLITALQYDSGPGHTALRTWAVKFVKEVFKPAYDDWDVILNSGNTDGWTKVVRLLCENGDYLLCEEQTYPSAQAVWAPMGCKALPIAIDDQGLRVDVLENLLSGWQSSHPGIRRPRLLYTVPVGSNPTGTTMQEARKRAIYDVCVKYDIVICEDDPYYFLQYPTYNASQPPYDPLVAENTTVDEYVKGLAPSFMSLDYQGRVIRLESFSKTLAPGNRVGFFVTNPIFIERLLRGTEVETQAPSGWAVLMLSNLLQTWGSAGYLQWLAQLRNQYRARRDWMCSALESNFVLKSVDKVKDPPTGAEGLLAYANGQAKAPIFSFVPPTAGMFLWARFYLYGSPRFQKLQQSADCIDPEKSFQDELWLALANKLVLLTPGSYYTPWQGKDKVTTEARGAENGICFFRLSFSMVTKEQMELGITRMHEVLQDFWQ